MGDVSDQADLDRYLRSPESREELAGIWHKLFGRKLTNVRFANLIHYVGIDTELDDGELFLCQLLELDVDAIRHRFDVVLDREYHKDYPERKET